MQHYKGTCAVTGAPFLALMIPSLLWASPMFGKQLVAFEAEDASPTRTSFSFGDSCKRLEELAWEDVAALLQPRVKEKWGRFCRAEGPYECQDFSHLFEGMGFLVRSLEEESMCRFYPYYYMREPSREIYDNYG